MHLVAQIDHDDRGRLAQQRCPGVAQRNRGHVIASLCHELIEPLAQLHVRGHELEALPLGQNRLGGLVREVLGRLAVHAKTRKQGTSGMSQGPRVRRYRSCGTP